PFSTNTSSEARTSLVRVFSRRRVAADSGSGSNRSVMAPHRDGRRVRRVSLPRPALSPGAMCRYYPIDTFVYRMRGRLEQAYRRHLLEPVLEVPCPRPCTASVV